MRRLAGMVVVIALTSAGCIELSSPDSSQTSSAETEKAQGGLDVVVHVQSSSDPRRRFNLILRCPGNNALPGWYPACRAAARNPSRLTDDYVDPACWGGAPEFLMRVRGVVDGERIDLRQAGMCGPAGIYAWYKLVAHYPHLPTWFNRSPWR